MDLINQVLLGENLGYIKKFSYETIDLIYIDPPFYSNKIYDDFNDVWKSLEEYINYIEIRINEMYRTLKKSGNFYLHCDPKASHYLKVLCDKIFGYNNFKSEIIWDVKSISGYKSQKKGWIRSHDTILHYTKSNNFTFNKIYLEYDKEYYKKFKRTDKDGRLFAYSNDNVMYLDERKGMPISDVWSDIISYQTRTRSKNYTGYSTQKPEEILERIIRSSSNKEDLVVDFFCGSGTTLFIAKKLNRNYFGCDNNPNAIKITKNRLKQINRTKSGVLGWL
ncbi:hypothetical protein LCGC14_2580060 [marine sediment metagenome]|uniref:DNA methylase N-4/N-6 domain-containing protein n=1 Tax=marine sediment metagenome TaxID=412755 RepID=A0A0F9CQS6_9ZZZZ